MAGALIAKAILGAIGGGLEGAAKGGTSNKMSDGSGIQSNGIDSDFSKGAGELGKAIKSKLDEKKSSTSLPTNNNNVWSAKNNVDFSKMSGNTSQAFGGAGGLGNAMSFMGGSDYNLKDIYKDIPDNIIENFAKISAIDFNYKPEAQAEYNGEAGVDGNEHIGVIAQELEKNPVTSGTVTEDERGNKVVDTRHLAFADTAAIGELSRRILALETVVMEMQQKLK